MRTLTRYLLFQVPSWILAGVVAVTLWRWGGVDAWIAVAVLVLWVVKDFVLYPFVKASYERGVATGAESLIGAVGVVQRRLNPRGLVRVRGALWRAEIRSSEPAVAKGEEVRVRGVRGLTLLVVKEEREEARSPSVRAGDDP